MRWSNLYILGLATVAIILTFVTYVQAREASVVLIQNNGVDDSSFCTSNGDIYIVHSGWNDAYGYYNFGNTLLQGQQTYRLGPGKAKIKNGCYSHKVENVTVFGNAWAKSTVWYDK